MKIAGAPYCSLPSCGKPTWNGQPGYCSKDHMAQGQALGIVIATPAASPGPGCSLPACGKPTWNGQPGYCSHNHKTQGEALKIVVAPVLVALDVASPEFQSVKGQFTSKWQSKSKTTPTKVQTIYKVQYPSTYPTVAKNEAFIARPDVKSVKIFGAFATEGNAQRRFQGTGCKCHPIGSNPSLCSDVTCAMCNIIHKGFDPSMAGKSTGDPGVYGDGPYFTSVSSTAKGYGISDPAYQFLKGGDWSSPKAGNVVLVCKVVCGKGTMIPANDVVQYPKVKISPNWTKKAQQPGEHSRIVNKVGNYDECVVFDGDQALVNYVIVFQ